MDSQSQRWSVPWGTRVLLFFALLCLVGSFYERYRNEFHASVSLWLLGILTLLVWGFGGWWGRRSVSFQDVAWICVIATVALVVRLGGNLREYPGLIDRDEIVWVISGRGLAGNFWSVLDLFWVGIPLAGALPSALSGYVFESSLWGVRAVNGVVATIGVVALYDLGRTLVSRRVGIAASLLLAVSHVSIYWSRMAQPFVQVATYGVVMMAFAVRAAQGGTPLAWSGAAISLGLGILCYQSAWIFPLILSLCLAPLAFPGQPAEVRSRALRLLLFMCVFGLLIAAPPFSLMLNGSGWKDNRTSVVAVSAESLQRLAPSYGMDAGGGIWPIALEHARRAFLMPWAVSPGNVDFAGYFPILDPVSGVAMALLPLLFFRRPWVAWICCVWIVSYILFGVVLCSNLPSYHRIVAVTVFTALAVAAVIEQLLPRRLRTVGLVVVCVCAGYFDLRWYFLDYRHQLPVTTNSGTVSMMCPFARSHTIIDGSVPTGSPWPDLSMELIEADCPIGDYRQVKDPNALWAFEKTSRDKVLIIAPSDVLARVVGAPPAGYEELRRWTDNRITYPRQVEMSLIELVKRP